MFFSRNKRQHYYKTREAVEGNTFQVKPLTIHKLYGKCINTLFCEAGIEKKLPSIILSQHELESNQSFNSTRKCLDVSCVLEEQKFNLF